MSVGWDASHGEFLIEDYYYFSKLKKLAEVEGIRIYQENDFKYLGNHDVIVFNYPEKRFKSSEIKKIDKWLRSGKKIIFATYYNNMDSTAENVNGVLEKLEIPIRINNDVVLDMENNAGDMMFPICKYKNYNVVMPCTSSLTVNGNRLIKSKGFNLYGLKNPVVGASFKDVGEIIVLGTCVFWDNYSIDLLDNKILALDLLKV